MELLSVPGPLSGWGRFPVEPGHLFRPEKRAGVADVLRRGGQPTYVSRGLGRSYGDAALNRDAGVISHLRLNRFLDWDPQAGTLECEAGASFDDILAFALPRGWMLPVTPGTRYVTVGGALAADVHGKNHHRDGTIAGFVDELSLLTPGEGVLRCSPAENADVFWATLGGMGLTGAILSARLRLRPVESAHMRVSYRRAPNLAAALEGFARPEADAPYSVAWIDCLAGGRSLGRSVLMLGEHAPAAALPASVRDPLARAGRGGPGVPFDLPSASLNRFTVAAFNAVYYAAHRDADGKLVPLDAFFYPLDAVQGWNRVYGRRGFVQFQAAVPLEGGERAVAALLERISGSRRSSFLAVLKRFGPANPGLLSFPFPGYTLALDLPAAPGIREFLQELNRLALDHGGRVYLAKDAVLDAETFAAMYPALPRFLDIRRRLDPEGRISSSLGRRLGITPAGGAA
jgi:decaprenylphospho-beta-D-ribofuranose 2-oxidase